MSERTRGSAPASEAKGHKRCELINKLKALASLCGDIRKEADDLISFEELRDERRRLRDDISAKETELKAKVNEVAARDAIITTLRAEKDKLLKEHRAEKDVLVKNFAEQAVGWREDSSLKEEREKAITDLTSRAIKAETTAERLNQQLDKKVSESQRSGEALQTALAEKGALEKDFRKADLGQQIAQKTLEETQTRLNTVMGETGITKLDQDKLCAPTLDMTV